MYCDNDNIINKEEEANVIYQLMSELQTLDKRELIGYAKCLHFQTSANNTNIKNNNSEATHIKQ